MRIDLHTHSTASDGTDSPAALLEAAAAAHLDVVALTDHDTMAGWAQAAEAAYRVGVALVPGVEVSCERDAQSVHIVGYLLDPADAALTAELAHARASRQTRLERMVALLAADGLPVTYAAVLAQVPPGATLGRPHIADALVVAGAARDRGEAFARWLHNDSPYFVRHYAPDPVTATRLILAAGGVPVLAHPFAARPGLVLPDGLVEELAAAGLVGVEAEHPEHDARARRRVRALAGVLGLLVTGSSDYHGAGKPTRLGQESTSPAVLDEIRARGTGAEVVGR
jgi:predicted metal-dependent phosphoesterase TrpH